MRRSTIKKPKVVSIHPSSALFKLENPPDYVLCIAMEGSKA